MKNKKKLKSKTLIKIKYFEEKNHPLRFFDSKMDF